jgi:hypothetical protein
MPPRPTLYRRPSTPANRQGLCPPDKVEAYCTYLEVMNRHAQWSLGHAESRESLTLPYHDEIQYDEHSRFIAPPRVHHQRRQSMSQSVARPLIPPLPPLPLTITKPTMTATRLAIWKQNTSNSRTSERSAKRPWPLLIYVPLFVGGVLPFFK